MRKITSQLGILAVSVLSIGVLAGVPVYAQHGSDESTTTTTTTTSGGDSSTISAGADSTSGSGSGSGSGSSGSSRTETSTTSDTRHSGETTEAVETETEGTSNDDTGKLRDEAAKLLEQKREGKSTKSTEDRQKACQAHQSELDAKISNYSVQAQKHLDTFTSIFTKVQQFQKDKGLSAANYGALVAIAQSKQTDAQGVVDALKAVSVTVDCSSNDPASAVATVKTAVKAAREALQAYRSSIKDVVVALQNAQDNSSAKTSETENQ